ncbi:AzlD domain-containing protein [Rossellomorea marisflavi]|nr:AzlD domain-containing protein [Rossellomorea marisflavi]MCM2603858.1 AzlD domain-containing protein [Rossellomorea marisflavi]
MDKMMLLMIAGMAFVTYVPRMLPFVMFSGKELHPFVKGVLNNVPYAVLGALIFPSIFLIKEGDVLFGVIGAVAAFALAFCGANVIMVVLGAIAILSAYTFLV